MICKKCDSAVMDRAKFCPKCGTKIEVQTIALNSRTKKCPKCGEENSVAAKYCKADGYSFELSGESVPAPVPGGENSIHKVLCPKCGAAYAPGIKFCKNDGASLKSDVLAISAVSTEIKTGIKQETAAHPRMATGITPSVKTDAVTPLSTLSEKIDKEKSIYSMTSSSNKTKSVTVAIVVLTLLFLTGAGSYLYLTGRILKKPEQMAMSINDELKSNGLNIYCVIDKDWIVTLKGATRSARDKDVASNIIRAHKEIKGINDAVRLLADPAEVKAAIDTALRNSGIIDIRVDVDENLIATLQGVAHDEAEKESALKLVTEFGNASAIKDNIQVKVFAPPSSIPIENPAPAPQPMRPVVRPKAEVNRRELTRQQNVVPPHQQPGVTDLAKFEGEINRALRNAGLSGITAEVGDNMNVTLKGSTLNPAHKSKAFDIANSYSGVNKVRDRIFVVQ